MPGLACGPPIGLPSNPAILVATPETMPMAIKIVMTHTSTGRRRRSGVTSLTAERGAAYGLFFSIRRR